MVQSDAGMYTCMAANLVGTATESVEVIVRGTFSLSTGDCPYVLLTRFADSQGQASRGGCLGWQLT